VIGIHGHYRCQKVERTFSSRRGQASILHAFVKKTNGLSKLQPRKVHEYQLCTHSPKQERTCRIHEYGQHWSGPDTPRRSLQFFAYRNTRLRFSIFGDAWESITRKSTSVSSLRRGDRGHHTLYDKGFCKYPKFLFE
jgi:hypothetical protein